MTSYGIRKKIKIERTVAKLFIYSMPFKMIAPLRFFNAIVGLGNRLPFLFLVLGIMIIVFSKKRIGFSNDNSSKLFKHFVYMYIIVDITSIIMAAILFKSLGTIGGENAFDAVIPKVLFSLAYIVILFYNRELFRVLSKEDINSILDRVTNICIVIGLWQIGVITFGGLFRSVYDFVNKLFDAWSSNSMIYTKRIALFTMEPSYIGGFLGIIIIPFILSKFISGKVMIRDFVKLCLIVLIIYYTKSTTGYVLVAVDFLLFGYFYLKKGETALSNRIIVLFNMSIALIILFYLIIGNTILSDTITNVFDKLINIDNSNSITRKAVLYIDWRIFIEYPILGVGNGNQGFFYREFYPQFILNSLANRNRFDEAANVLMDGGSFFPSFASGYGLVGIVLLVIFVYKSIKTLRTNKSCYGYLYYFYIMGAFSLLLYGFSSTLASDYCVWFVVSLPMASYYWNKDSV